MCNCSKRSVATQPKKIIKSQPSNTNNTNRIKRIIRRAAR